MSLISHLKHIEESSSTGWNLGRSNFRQLSEVSVASSIQACDRAYSGTDSIERSKEYVQRRLGNSLATSTVLKKTEDRASAAGDSYTARSSARPESLAEFQTYTNLTSFCKDLPCKVKRVDFRESYRPRGSQSTSENVEPPRIFPRHQRTDLSGDEARSKATSKLLSVFNIDSHTQCNDSGNQNNQIIFNVMSGERSHIKHRDPMAVPGDGVSGRRVSDGLLPHPTREEKARALLSVSAKTTKEDNIPTRGLDPDSVRGRLLRQKGFTIPRVYSSGVSGESRGNDFSSEGKVGPNVSIDSTLFYSANWNSNMKGVQSRKPTAANRENVLESVGQIDNLNFVNAVIESSAPEGKNSSQSEDRVMPAMKTQQQVLNVTCNGLAENDIFAPKFETATKIYSQVQGSKTISVDKRDASLYKADRAQDKSSTNRSNTDNRYQISQTIGDKIVWSRPEYVRLSCPSCKEVQNVLNRQGITHTCTGCANLYHLVDTSNNLNIATREPRSVKPGTNVPKKRPLSTKQRRTNKRTPQKPECVTISSDEEEVNLNSKVELESTPDERHMHGSSVGTQEKAEEVSHINEKGEQSADFNKTQKFSQKMKLQGGVDPDGNTKHCKTTFKESLSIDIDFIQFGSVAGKALQPMDISDKRIQLRVGMSSEYHVKSDKHEDFVAAGSFEICLEKHHINVMKLHVGRRPSLFVLYPTENMCSQVNSKFGKEILSVNSGDFIQKQIMITFSTNPISESMAEEIIKEIRNILTNVCDVQLMSQKEAEHIYTKIQTYEISNRVCNSKLATSTQKASTTPSTTTGNAKTETLLVYPKPAAHGSVTITADDIECLADGVYLNDVIIDFYLRFLLESKLKEEDRRRTHLFSSFFYKRLTQKTPRYNLSEEMAKLSLPERMHQLVKNWTRNIDIFEKDFILIPVNEHSHWYLVIICFPSMVPVESDQLLESKSEIPSDSEDASDLSLMETDDHQGTEICLGMDVDEKIQSPMAKSPVGSINSPLGIFNSLVGNASSPVVEMGSGSTSFAQSVSTATLSASKPLSGISQHVLSSSLQDIWNPVPCILIFDSLGLKSSNRVFTNLRNYLTQEWKTKRPSQKLKVFDKDTMKGSFPKLPLQSNDCDCGIYVLQYAETFFSKPFSNFKAPIKKGDWFPKDVITRKRNEIKDLVFKLKNENQDTVHDCGYCYVLLVWSHGEFPDKCLENEVRF